MLQNVMLNIFQRKMYALRCKNAFLHQMHFCIKCIFASNAFLHSIKCICNILLVLNIFLWKMWCWTFSFGKCTPKCILPLSNILVCWTFSFGKCTLNIFQRKMYAKMHFCIKCIFASNAFLHQQNVRVASNAFLHQMHFCTALLNIFQRKMFSTNKMYASLFFAKQKTQHFCIKSIFPLLTFCFAEHFPKQNVRKRQNALFFARQSNCAVQKYIFASHLTCFVFSVFCTAKRKEAKNNTFYFYFYFIKM